MSDEWKLQAACRGGNENWFPTRGESTETLKFICNNKCPVRDECLEYALAHNETNGVWGGMSERQRRKLRKERQARRLDDAA